MTFTHLTLGEPRLKGRLRGDVPCTEPRVLSSNRMGALGTFENATSEFTGDDGHPFFRDTSPVSSHNGSETGWLFSESSWTALTALGLSSIGRTTDNPRSGSRALRVVWSTDDNTVILRLAGGGQCGVMTNPPVSFRAREGDLVTYSIWYEVNWVAAGASWGLSLEFIDPSFSYSVPIHTETTDGSTSDVGTYTQLTASAVAPADTYWVNCAIRISGNGTFDFDDVTLGIA